MIRTVLALLALAASARAQVSVAGVVFEDTNGNGVRDPGERGVPNVVVSNQDAVEKTDASGRFGIARGPTGIVFVSVPNGFRIVGSFWHSADERNTDFALEPERAPTSFTFIHASDTHISPASLARTRRFRAMADSVNPDFVIITGDLVRDALRVNEAEATGYYDLFAREVATFRNAVWTVPGNHENFGIERAQSKVERSHPLYGRAMYRHYRGPDYYSFTYGGVHFVGLNSVDIDDQWYYGHVDSAQVAWLERDLATIPAEMPVVTFNHIPFFTAVESINGYSDAPPAPSVITVNGKSQFRHNVSNALEILTRVGMSRFAIALGGHMHVREQLRYAGIPLRFNQTAAVVGPGGSGVLTFPSGITVYRVTNGVVDDGAFLPLDPASPQ
ncbi:MAG: putative Ser/Thr protein phosphatase [Gemmatimonadetes bacterium]|nr:putative Ser/Thr protein phosphatase [Gemmatimonadota bacterium]